MADTPARAPDPADLGGSRPRRRRWLRRLVVALILAPVIALIAVLVVVATLPTWVTPDRVRREAITAARDALGVEVDIAELDYHPSWGLVLRGLRVGPPTGFTRDVLTLGALELRWRLPWSSDGAVVIERAALVSPHVVVETVNGVRNVDALLPPSGEPPPPPKPSEPLRGPLSPVHVILRDVAIEDVHLELVGEGPQASVQGLSMRLAAELDPAKLSASLAITSSAAGAPTIRARIPRPGLADQQVSTTLRGRIQVDVAARTHDGLALDLFALETILRAEGLDLHGEPPIPRSTVAFEAGAKLDAGQDTFVLDRVALAFDDRELLRIGAEVDGVVAAVLEAVEAPGDLVAALGLVRSGKDGRVTVRGPGLTLALDPLRPFIQPFVPGLDVSGTARLVVEDVSGFVTELKAMRPARGGVRLELEALRVNDPAHDLSIGALDGGLAVRAQGAEPIAIEGRISGRRVRSGPNLIETLTLGADGSLERPTYPQTGNATVAVTLALGQVRAPGATVDALETRLVLSGVDPLDPARTHPLPVRVGVALKTRGVSVGTGTAAQSIASVEAELDAELDRLLTPATTPITAALKTTVRGFSSPAAQVEEVVVALDATVDDPRVGQPIAARLDGKIDVSRARTPQATVGRASLALRTRATGVDPSGADPLPATAVVDATLDVPAFALAPPSTLATHARVDAQVDFTKAGQKLVMKSIRARLGDVVDATVSGRVDRALAAVPELDVHFVLAPLDLSKPVVPKMLGEPFTGSGTVRFEARAKGRWTGADDLMARLDAPPLETSAALSLDGVSVSMPERQIVLEGATGQTTVTLSKAEAGTRGELRLDAAAQGAQGARGLQAQWALGLDEGVWRARVGLDAAHLGDGSRSVEAASVDVDVVHPPFGDVSVRQFVIAAPGAGLEVVLDGRLARGRYGAVLPDLDASLQLDFDKLKSVFGAAVPDALKVCSGRLGMELGAHAPRDTRVEIGGAVVLDRFGWRGPGTLLRNATGRIPFSQLLHVSAPTDALLAGREKATSVLAEGGIGLQRSLDDLADALQRRSRYVLSATDVLVVAPRTADYESLRPYYRSPSSAKMTIEELAYAHYRLTAASADVSYRNGVFKIDRFATRLWDGDLFGEMAFQVAEQDHLRFRMRATLTDLNLDVPVAAASGRTPAQGGAAEPYQVAGNFDVRLDLRDRTLDGYFDFTKMGSDVLVGLIDGLDPERKSSGLQQTRETIGSGMDALAIWTGVSLQGTTMTIRNNLLDIDYKWAFDPFGFPDSLIYLGVPIVTRSFLGPTFMEVTNSAVKGYSLSNYLEAPWVKNLNESVFTAAVRGRLVVEGPDDDGDDDALARGEPR